MLACRRGHDPVPCRCTHGRCAGLEHVARQDHKQYWFVCGYINYRLEISNCTTHIFVAAMQIVVVWIGEPVCLVVTQVGVHA